MLKTCWREGWHWPAARKLRNSGIQNFETLIFLISDLIWVILNNFCRNSSFTRPAGGIIASADPARVFHPVWRPRYIFLQENMSFSWGQLSRTYRVHLLQPISRPCGMEKVYPREWRIAIPASLMPVHNDLYHSGLVPLHATFLKS